VVFRLLVKRDNVKTNLKDKYSRMPLLGAAAKGHKGVVRLLVKRDDVNADSKDIYG